MRLIAPCLKKPPTRTLRLRVCKCRRWDRLVPKLKPRAEPSTRVGQACAANALFGVAGRLRAYFVAILSGDGDIHEVGYGSEAATDKEGHGGVVDLTKHVASLWGER